VRGLGLAGLIAIAFGLGSYYATKKLSLFGELNLALGTLALLVAGAVAARRLRGFGTPDTRRLLGRHALLLLGLLGAAIALERGADALGLRFDWTLDRRYELSPATREILAALPDDLLATLFFHPEDPRIRSTRLLLEAFAGTGEIEVRELDAEKALTEADRFGVSSSNTVVFETSGRWERVPRPTEGALWEALQQLGQVDARRALYLTRGEGEGDPTRGDGLGYSGVAAALRTEGSVVRDLVLAASREVPADAAAVLIVAPRRPLRTEALELLRDYLGGGGGLLALVDPGSNTGLEELLAEYGFALPDGVVVDPASGPIEGAPPGVNPLAHAYSDHPVVRELDANRMTFFPQVRPVEAVRKPRAEDRLSSVVYSSPRAWLSKEVEAVARGFAPRDRAGAAPRRYPLASVGRYPRGTGETRIAVFGDSDFASNRYLRSLYNLDLFMNAVHWVVKRESAITRRPKALTSVQRPLPPVESLAMLYGVGLLLPEVLLIAASVAWLRRRSA
jgi:hypothetical protein